MPLPALEELKPVFGILQGIKQDPVYHGEGDAAAHTALVLEKLGEMSELKALDSEARSIMTTAAALHDLGKAVCTKLEDGRWTSPNHSRIGACMVRQMLMTEYGLCGTPEAIRVREAVCTLILWHMRPLHVLERSKPERVVRQMAATGELTRDFTLRRLATLSKADCLGRICEDTQARLDEVSMFEQLAEEQSCLDEPFSYADAFSRFADFSGRDVAAGEHIYNDRLLTVTMLSGLPGTGKDTWYHQRLSNLPMLSLDELRLEMHISPVGNQGAVIQAAQEKAREYLRGKQPFVFNATNLSAVLRGKWLRLFHDYGAYVRIVYLETPWDERRRRNRERERTVPESAVLRMLDKLEPPTLTEAEEVEWVCV